MYSMPAAVVGFRSSALMMRLTRSSMLEVLRQDYIRTARSKGASERVVNFRHALKNAVLPVVTVIGIEAAFLMGGLIVTETVFNIPGVARFLVEAIRWRDYPIVQNLVMYIAIIVVVDQFHRSTCCTRRSTRASNIRISRSSRRAEETTVSTVDYHAELAKAGANVHSRWSAGPFLRAPLSAGRDRRGDHGALRLRRVFAPLITVYDPLSTNAALSLARPSAAHWLGCDFMGRDVYSRIVYGARISLAVGIGSTVLGGSIGVIIGLLSGYLGGWIDLVAQRLIDILQSLPLLVMAIAHGGRARAVAAQHDHRDLDPADPLRRRGSCAPTRCRLREQPFVESAKAIGMSEFRIALRHVLPNTLAPLIVLATAQLGSTILTEASLSFLGLGVPEPHPSWGRMLSESAAEYVRTAPWLVIFPGVAISARRLRHQPLGRRAARHPRPAPAQLIGRGSRARNETSSAHNAARRCSRSTGCGPISSPAPASSRRSTTCRSRVQPRRDAGDRRRVGLRQDR